jgi:hypothetical protein
MDWIIVAGLMAISLVLCICMLHLTGRISMLETDIKRLRGLDEEYKPRDLAKEAEAKDAIDRNYAEIEKKLVEYNESYGDPTYTDWIDSEYDKKGVK